MLRDNPDVRLVIKEPILSQSSLVAAKAAIAAEMQGKFGAYHIAMMTIVAKSPRCCNALGAQAGVDEKQLKVNRAPKRRPLSSVPARQRRRLKSMARSGGGK